ncbi:MAG TPA: hopanoid biosynthesis-associated protein HpnK [Candidatus Baltobacteraceae bacterium]|nr:hopanoid biosynthesis-associated protein HpnK [Candidatus Baltobacteraceae bacterium]
MRRLIVSADDFGLDVAVNEAVERGNREGILSTASLMVAAPAFEDAVARARNLPNLRVGLHVVLVNGKPKLPPERVPLLVDKDGNFAADLFRAGVKYFFTPGIRAQLEAEVRAQFEAFAQTGLPLDHVNAQNHFHVHPTVLSVILKAGKPFGLRAVRIPYEPFGPSWRAMRRDRRARLANDLLLKPWMMLMRARLHRAGIATNDYVFGMNDSGHMTPDRIAAFLRALPDGISEVYTHPATHAWPGAFPADYDFAGEFAALIDPQNVALARSAGIQPVTFTELARER